MSEKPALLRGAARRVGQLITAAAIVFLGWELYQQWGKINDWRPTAGQIALLMVLALAYASALLGLAFNWVTILRALITDPVPTRQVLLSYTKTQIAKYVPGNFLHFVSRHMYLKDLGLAHRPIAGASVLELASLPIAAILAIGLSVPFAGTETLGRWGQRDLALVAIFAGIIVGIAATALIWRNNGHLLRPASVVLGRATGFMLAQGLLFAIVLYSTAGTFVALAIPVAILAWLVGFVTPGAPGGVAVREALIINLLSGASLQEDVLIAALLFRAVTTAGDLALYALGNLVLAK